MTPQRIPAWRCEQLEGEPLAQYDISPARRGKRRRAVQRREHGRAGTFDLEMQQESYPGVTLFAQLPGPVAGMLAFNELVACSKRLHSRRSAVRCR